ncbi:MAG TPA: hypothetical protein VGH95_04500 [Candidatus Aquirickettsiella sp.]|jgi:hypothetical protein
MIIEAITAYTAVKITWETLEILHLLHVGHETGKHGYKAGSFIANALQQQLQEREYEKDPLLRLVHEAETEYDSKDIEKHNKDAYTYLNELNQSLDTLNSAKFYLLKTHHQLEKLVNALYIKDEEEFLTRLSKFKINFEAFKDNFSSFSMKIKSPNRKILYIADISNQRSIKRFNEYLTIIDIRFKELKDTKEKMDVLFETRFRDTNDANDFLSEASSSSALPFEELKQKISECMVKPKLIEETMQKILPKNTKLAEICTKIAQISTAFKKIDNTHNEQTSLWNDDPNWLPLLTEKKQIEVGQRIFLHAMNETGYGSFIKLQMAKIFLYQYVSEHELNQVTIKLLSQRLANLLIAEQIKKCETLIEFLNNLTEGDLLPDQDADGLLEWLKITRRTVNSVEYWKRILVSPFTLSKYHIEVLQPKLEILFPNENVDLMIKEYRASYWGAIRETSDQLIQFSTSFKTKITPDDRSERDEQFFEDPNSVTSLMDRLSKKLVIELETLKMELYEKKELLEEGIFVLRDEEQKIRTRIKNLKHENAIERIKESHRYISSLEESCNRLLPYLHQFETINEIEKKRQVPTVDDLIQVIYRGVDLHGICKCKGDPNSNTNLLEDYFYPEHKKDTKLQAFAYAVSKCRINAQTLLHVYSYPAEPLLAIGNGDVKNPSIVIILKNSQNIYVPLDSMALNNISPKAKDETETFFNDLGDYYKLSYMRLKPECRKELPLAEKFKLLIQGLFNIGKKIREERFESVQVIMGKLRAVVSAEDILSINKAIKDFKENYENSYKAAKKTFNSTLYNLVNKAINGCISEMDCLSEAELKQLELEKEIARMKNLQASLDAVKQEKEDLEIKLKESEAQRERDRAEIREEFETKRLQDKKAMEAQREQDKADTDAQINELRNLFGLRQQSSSSLDTQIQEKNGCFFKP